MSGDESGSDSEDDLSTTGLIATRAKRATAGNLYATLRANLDDEELQKELLAEEEEGDDAADYEGSEKEGHDDGDNDNDEDDALESSSEEEDGGPPQEGEAEDLEGEKALRKVERAEQRKKRKVHDARLKLPAWRKKQEKRVKLADDVKTEDGGGGSTSERPRKKSERSNWLPSTADAPTRQSARASAVANRENIHANLKQSAERSEKQRRVMKNAAQREMDKRRMDGLSQEDRLKKCERIERETAKELGKWEREEAERERLREEALAAKRKRGVDGPLIRQWSGSVLWVGDKIKVRRISHGSTNVEEVKLPGEGERRESGPGQDTVSIWDGEDIKPSMSAHTVPYYDDLREQTPLPSKQEDSGRPLDPPALQHDLHALEAESLLSGIQAYAAQPDPLEGAHQNSIVPPTPVNYTPSAPGINTSANAVSVKLPQSQPPLPPSAPQDPVQYQPGRLPGTHQFSILSTTPQPPPPPAVPLIREQAQRSLIMLKHFGHLDTTSTTRRNRAAKDTSFLETDPVKSILLPNSHLHFNPEEVKYLLAKHKKKANEYHLAAAPPKDRCAVTSWPAKFRDPKTGLPYADMHQYKVIQRILAGGCQWSALLGCWVGPAYGRMGRPARGVPDAFAGIMAPPATETAAAAGASS